MVESRHFVMKDTSIRVQEKVRWKAVDFKDTNEMIRHIIIGDEYMNRIMDGWCDFLP